MPDLCSSPKLCPGGGAPSAQGALAGRQLHWRRGPVSKRQKIISDKTAPKSDGASSSSSGIYGSGRSSRAHANLYMSEETPTPGISLAFDANFWFEKMKKDKAAREASEKKVTFAEDGVQSSSGVEKPEIQRVRAASLIFS